MITKYDGRVARHTFIAHTVNPIFINSKAAAMAIYEYVSGERLPRDANKAKDTVIRMTVLVLSTQDFEIVQELRTLKGRLESPLFDMFWMELKKLLQSHARVDDRRHGACTINLHALLKIRCML